MESNSRPSLLTNINYLKTIINQDPEELSELLAQKEVSSLFSMNEKDQEIFLSNELEQRTNTKERDVYQFYLNRKSLWTELITSNPEKALSMIQPIIQFEVENGTNLETFILLETIH
jgi:hypothetical protein